MTQTTIAVLFDIDGTLVDSNYLHVEAWQRAFQEMGTDVDAWRIHRSIGQDGDELITSLVGEQEDAWTSKASELNSTYYMELTPRLRIFDGARELLRTLAERGVTVVLATSAPQDELDVLLRVIDSDDVIHATTNADDVDTAKPEPDIVRIALSRAGVDADHAVFIGDSVWDMKAALRAGVTPYGVLSGGISGELLTDAGARAVFDDPADLLDRLDEIALLG
ncbi:MULTISPECIES: HAD family hydrolase [unclassified Leifsonia]|uniref:HAD family hydrolase n=1 Tax=unclassified Leifsonia TaxID=2663824 RepID=UPI0006F360A5|nr:MULTISPECIES: HAD family hydrolase [unclassified Leifsonia]KQX07611.1 HAD family hydrolase [Leifsonia sp. Root1293]KRA11893.1 HAD family hydrolase [Leifsonia sp. Root60]